MTTSSVLTSSGQLAETFADKLVGIDFPLAGLGRNKSHAHNKSRIKRT